MNTPHKHAAVIKAWADGAQVQGKMPSLSDDMWVDVDEPFWASETFEYRIKPTVITRDMRILLCRIRDEPYEDFYIQPNLRLTFTDGVLTDATVIKE